MCAVSVFNSSVEMLDACRLQQDPLADEVIASYVAKDKAALRTLFSQVKDNRYRPSKKAPAAFQKLYRSVYKSWKPEEVLAMKKGQEFFARHSSDIMMLLGLLSLPYCYAAAQGAEVLIRSKRIQENPGKRLMETGEFVFDVTAPGALLEDGKGLASILKVRLIHAMVRHYINQGGDWLAERGKPVNQEDMAGTNLSFSLIPVRGLRKLGKAISSEQSIDYISYWNLIGERLGLKSELQPGTTKEAYLLERNIRQRQFKKSEAGRVLTSALLAYFEEVTKGTPMQGKSKAFVHHLLGEKVAALLGVEISRLELSTFRPISEMIRFRNLFQSRTDTYMAAYRNFERQKKELTGEGPGGFHLP